jgi:hypothetical protein
MTVTPRAPPQAFASRIAPSTEKSPATVSVPCGNGRIPLINRTGGTKARPIFDYHRPVMPGKATSKPTARIWSIMKGTKALKMMPSVMPGGATDFR